MVSLSFSEHLSQSTQKASLGIVATDLLPASASHSSHVLAGLSAAADILAGSPALNLNSHCSFLILVVTLRLLSSAMQGSLQTLSLPPFSLFL